MCFDKCEMVETKESKPNSFWMLWTLLVQSNSGLHTISADIADERCEELLFLSKNV